MAKGKKSSVVITVTDAALADIKSVAAALKAAGLTVDRTMPVTGVITGTCDPAKKAALGAVPGVHSVEDEVQVNLPPPGSDPQ